MHRQHSPWTTMDVSPPIGVSASGDEKKFAERTIAGEAIAHEQDLVPALYRVLPNIVSSDVILSNDKFEKKEGSESSLTLRADIPSASHNCQAACTMTSICWFENIGIRWGRSLIPYP
mmetsp:Transcript_37544/g.90571  ORF Transcript_37544/g.90571 Transcript_37544/m.90571 type:complete len:118 (-) Transcript_37544:1462-1815(-)